MVKESEGKVKMNSQPYAAFAMGLMEQGMHKQGLKMVEIM